MAAAASFPIPASFTDLERAPYNLLPYPQDFADEDEAVRADSFSSLVQLLEQGNRTLASRGMAVLENPNGDGMEDDNNGWLDDDRMQAMYTLVRKSLSLAPSTRARLIEALCSAVKTLSSILIAANGAREGQDVTTATAPQCFRDAFACHLYMLFSVMFLVESEAKVGNGEKTRGASDKNDAFGTVALRAICAETMLVAAEAMAQSKHTLWKSGVPEISVVILPCRIAFQLLEGATGVNARKAVSADVALAIIASAVDSTESLLGTIVTALMDLLHSYEHIAPLCAKLCCMVSEERMNRLAAELLREISRLEPVTLSGSDAAAKKASGIRNVAPFISEFAAIRPRIVQANISILLPLLNSDPYNLRSAIVTAIGYVLEDIFKRQNATGQAEGTNMGNEDEHSSANLAKVRDSLLGVLSERAHDVSSFTRAAVMKALINLSQSGSLPVQQTITLTALAIDRLRDKTVVARRQAMQLLTNLLENNPFMDNLDPEPYRKKLQDLIDVVKAKMPSNIKNAQDEALQAAASDQAGEGVIMEIQAATLAAALGEADALAEMEELGEDETEFLSLVKVVRYTQNALEFITQLEGVTEAIDTMLFSVKESDVTEALRFLVKARHFKLPFATPGIKRALALMWSSEQSIKDEVLKAFVEVFLATPASNGEENLPSKQIADNLLLLTCQATVSELACIEEVLVRLVKDMRIPADVFKTLWSVATKQRGDLRATAMQLIAIGARADRSIVESKSRLKSLLDAGLGDDTEEHHDWNTARCAAVALQCVERAEVDPTCAKYLVLERIMERLCSLARGDWCRDARKEDTILWFSAAEKAVVALFVISPKPEAICSEILHGMHAAAFGDLSNVHTACHPLRVARFFHVLGHIALNLLVYTEALSSSVRRANSKKSLKKQEEAQKSKTSSADEENNIEAELGMAAEEEAENERQAAEISEKEIVGRGLISLYEPLLTRVVLNEGGHCKSKVLLQSATLALCKLMCVSSSFCEKHLPLLFKVLANEKFVDTTTQSNIVVALGDIAFRFPNEVEPYTAHLYAGLRDPSRKVRRHTLMVLTHLILNDMVKVKGQVSEIALCLQDEDVKIRDLSRLLFHQLSKRSNNVIYNLLPDIISRLSEQSLPRENFRGIMSFLFSFIDKDRQNDVLIDKMCQRFPLCSSISQKGDLAFCIAQIKMTDRTVKCLDDKFKLYQDALVDDDVKKHFFSIVTKAKKFAKPELKQSIEEWEVKLSEFAEIGMENQMAGDKAARAMAQVSKRAARKGRSKKTTQKEEDEALGRDDEDLADATSIAQVSKRTTRAKGRSKQYVEEDDDDANDDNESEVEDEVEFTGALEKENTPKRSKAPKASKKTPRKQQQRASRRK